MDQPDPARPSITSHFTFPWPQRRVSSVEGVADRVPEAPSWVTGDDNALHMKPKKISSLIAWVHVMVLTAWQPQYSVVSASITSLEQTCKQLPCCRSQRVDQDSCRVNHKERQKSLSHVIAPRNISILQGIFMPLTQSMDVPSWVLPHGC